MGFNSDLVLTTFIYCTSTLLDQYLKLLTGVPLNNCKLNHSMQLHRKLEIGWIYSQLYLPCFTLLWAPWVFWSAISTFIRTFPVFEIPRRSLSGASIFITRCSITISGTLFVPGRSLFWGPGSAVHLRILVSHHCIHPKQHFDLTVCSLFQNKDLHEQKRMRWQRSSLHSPPFNFRIQILTETKFHTHLLQSSEGQHASSFIFNPHSLSRISTLCNHLSHCLQLEKDCPASLTHPGYTFLKKLLFKNENLIKRGEINLHWFWNLSAIAWQRKEHIWSLCSKLLGVCF